MLRRWWKYLNPGRRRNLAPWVTVTLIESVWMSGGEARIEGILVGVDKIGIAVETSERDTHFVPWNNVSDVHAERGVIER